MEACYCVPWEAPKPACRQSLSSAIRESKNVILAPWRIRNEVGSSRTQNKWQLWARKREIGELSFLIITFISSNKYVIVFISWKSMLCYSEKLTTMDVDPTFHEKRKFFHGVSSQKRLFLSDFLSAKSSCHLCLWSLSDLKDGTHNQTINVIATYHFREHGSFV